MLAMAVKFRSQHSNSLFTARCHQVLHRKTSNVWPTQKNMIHLMFNLGNPCPVREFQVSPFKSFAWNCKTHHIDIPIVVHSRIGLGSTVQSTNLVWGIIICRWRNIWIRHHTTRLSHAFWASIMYAKLNRGLYLIYALLRSNHIWWTRKPGNMLHPVRWKRHALSVQNNMMKTGSKTQH